MNVRATLVLYATLGVVAVTCAAPAKAATYNITIAGGHGTQLPWMKAIEEFYIPEVDKRLAGAGGKDNIVWTKAFGGTLVKIGGELDGVREGIADMAMLYTIFEPARLPLLQVTFQAPFGSDDPTLISKIMVEMNQEMPELKAQWDAHGQVYLGAIATDTDHTWTKFPVAKLEDYKGRKLGASGSLSLWANGIGAVAVQGDFATHYNNVKTGVYDGLIAFTSGIYPTKVHEVAPYMTKVSLGAMSIGAMTMNKKLFDSMSPETQKVFRDVGIEYSQRVAVTVKNVAGLFEKKMIEEGAKVSEFPAAERKRWATTMPNIGKDWVKRNEERGVPAKKVLETYMAKLRAAKVELVRDWDKE